MRTEVSLEILEVIDPCYDTGSDGTRQTVKIRIERPIWTPQQRQAMPDARSEALADALERACQRELGWDGDREAAVYLAFGPDWERDILGRLLRRPSIQVECWAWEAAGADEDEDEEEWA